MCPCWIKILISLKKTKIKFRNIQSQNALQQPLKDLGERNIDYNNLKCIQYQKSTSLTNISI